MVNATLQSIWLYKETLKRTFNIITLLLSISGILGWKYFEDYVWIALILISIIQVFTLIENQLIRSDKEIEEISALRMMYTKYYNKLEKLWTNYQNNNITDDEVLNQFYELQEHEWEKIEALDCKLNIKSYNRMRNNTEIDTNKLYKQIFNLMSKKDYSIPRSQPSGRPTNNPGGGNNQGEVKGNVPTMRNPPPPPKRKD